MQFRSTLQLSFDKKKKTNEKTKAIQDLIITMNTEDTSFGKIPLTETKT